MQPDDELVKRVANGHPPLASLPQDKNTWPVVLGELGPRAVTAFP